MSDLTSLERHKLEGTLGMKTGYVLDFSNRTFQDFVMESTGRDIYDAKYRNGTDSKAYLLRGFWKKEGNQIVGKLLGDLIEYGVETNKIIPNTKAFEELERIVARLAQGTTISEPDAFSSPSDERDFEVVAKAVQDAINSNELESGLDRLHTFVTKYVRRLCTRQGLDVEREKPLHSLFGEYVKKLRSERLVESEMTERILTSSISVLEAFNHVRNHQSLAHDNPVLNYEEALLIFNHVATSIRFLRSIESRCHQQFEKQNELLGAWSSDDAPF